MVTRCGSVSRRAEMSPACNGTWTSCMAPPASTTSTITPSIVPYNWHKQIGPAPQALQMSVCRSWSAVGIESTTTHQCETFGDLPRLTLQGTSPTCQPFLVPANNPSTRSRLVVQVGGWVDVGATRNRLSSNGGETRETTTAGCTCRGADEPSKTTFDKDSKNWDGVKHTFIPGMKRVFNKK